MVHGLNHPRVECVVSGIDVEEVANFILLPVLSEEQEAGEQFTQVDDFGLPLHFFEGDQELRQNFRLLARSLGLWNDPRFPEAVDRPSFGEDVVLGATFKGFSDVLKIQPADARERAFKLSEEGFIFSKIYFPPASSCVIFQRSL